MQIIVKQIKHWTYGNGKVSNRYGEKVVHINWTKEGMVKVNKEVK